ncbi:hypothetical protein A2962_01960 [Candidatus Woesebacteria bacterium RIFCSPLOWO2_01_FULL_39_61]|uniref:Single-stranded DNA-binding protein n=1 Tax=Candidatus Woesebacteria bacterium RIFCSPHIGHO2_02_FULL_39_13 TaxID=1802505 RepID=A0A1F7Z1G2_9BACT|nr:MAG: hypothetical protein A2692_02680 [Candidatus Woesebacteria bacterium RIFCSPHIGHO2_01_FULL_39_95]OGM33274.1 MAG: hypothetical protein A3D01_00600 [Candidatus Woesebacteria bacterium RIFCSPHIGHO2_02_FULL_39_13]OGM38446.1 MAG: hypothetical protein A3E13_00480 [Candidatus Woesebacteria bacterium RIFCSPHIGHO2_12_FULL_40_20]OGM66884.1 MAG: hypothetical protein A2962_01960 [Candidatus Woesebacteria bacterium RIFCSPLOWO2_01_FULL_39_61]OGM75323.1 MAG: hypothetical protein A3H19_02860 [Candidatus
MARSLNKVELIGNLTRDPELRYTPAGTAVCTFGLATNRQWTVDSGEKREEVEFHRIVAWNKLAELCAQLLAKGRKAYVEGRLQTRRWTGQDGTEKITTEIVINDMIILDSRFTSGQSEEEFNVPEGAVEEAPADASADAPAQATPRTQKKAKPDKSSKAKTKDATSGKAKEDREDESEDIPF